MPQEGGLTVRFSRAKGLTAKGRLSSNVYLQCTLDDFTIEEPASHEEFNTIGAGQFSRPGSGNQLQTIALESLAVDATETPWLVDDRSGQDEIRRELRSVMRSRTPFELLVQNKITGETVVGFQATLRSLNRTIKPGEANTLYLNMQITQWRDASVVRRSSNRGRGGKDLPTKHRITANTTLRSLARHYYGTEEGWRRIANENGIRNWGGKTPIAQHRRWKVGQQIRVPVYQKKKGSTKRRKRDD